MELSILPTCEVLELTVVFFQVLGVGALCLFRLFPHTRLADHARMGYVLSLVGLGLSGALCGQHDSQFALFAGVTVTILFIGMICGAGSIELSRRSGQVNRGKTAFGA